MTMAKLLRSEPLHVTSFNFNERDWVIYKILQQLEPNVTGNNLFLYLTECVDEQNFNLKEYYYNVTQRKAKGNNKGENKE